MFEGRKSHVELPAPVPERPARKIMQRILDDKQALNRFLDPMDNQTMHQRMRHTLHALHPQESTFLAKELLRTLNDDDVDRRDGAILLLDTMNLSNVPADVLVQTHIQIITQQDETADAMGTIYSLREAEAIINARLEEEEKQSDIENYRKRILHAWERVPVPKIQNPQQSEQKEHESSPHLQEKEEEIEPTKAESIRASGKDMQTLLDPKKRMPHKGPSTPQKIKSRRERVLSLEQDNLTQAKIAELLGYSERTIRGDRIWLSENGATRVEVSHKPPQEELDKRREDVFALAQRGLSRAQIGEELGLDSSIVHRNIHWLIKHGKLIEATDYSKKVPHKIYKATPSSPDH